MVSQGVRLSLWDFQTPVFYLWATQHWMMDVDLGYVTPHPFWTPSFLKSIKGAAVHFRKQISYFTKSVLMYGVNFFIEMQIKTTMRYQFTPVRMSAIQKSARKLAFKQLRTGLMPMTTEHLSFHGNLNFN